MPVKVHLLLWYSSHHWMIKVTRIQTVHGKQEKFPHLVYHFDSGLLVILWSHCNIKLICATLKTHSYWGWVHVESECAMKTPTPYPTPDLLVRNQWHDSMLHCAQWNPLIVKWLRPLKLPLRRKFAVTKNTKKVQQRLLYHLSWSRMFILKGTPSKRHQGSIDRTGIKNTHRSCQLIYAVVG